MKNDDIYRIITTIIKVSLEYLKKNNLINFQLVLKKKLAI